MIGLTEEQLNHILNGDLINVRMTIVPAGESEQLIVTSENIMDSSCVLDRNIMSTSEFSIGNVESAELMFTLINDDDQYDDITFEGARVTFEIELDEEPVQLGIFTIDQRPTRGRLMIVRALDLMARFDKPFKKETYSFPINLKALIQQMCDDVGVVDDTGEFTNFDVEVDDLDGTFDECTYRDLLSWVASLAGANAFIAPDGKLIFRLFEETGLEISEQLVGDNFITAESEIEITGVEFVIPPQKDWVDGEQVEIPEIRYLAGDDTYTVDLSDNPLLKIIDDKETVIDAVEQVLGGFTYLPISALNTIGLPQVIAGDFFTVAEYQYEYPDPIEDPEDPEEIYVEPDRVTVRERRVFVTHHKWVVNGDSLFRSVGETETEKGYASGQRLTPSQKAQVTRIINRREAELRGDLVNSYVDIQLDFHEEIANALGYYITVQIDEYGREVRYTHDEPTLEASQYIEYKPGAGQFAWTTSGWNDGNPDWQYGVSKEGSALFHKIISEGIDIGQPGDPYMTKLTPSTWEILYHGMPVVRVVEDEMRIPKVITSEYYGVGRIKFQPAFDGDEIIGTDIVFMDDPSEI